MRFFIVIFLLSTLAASAQLVPLGGHITGSGIPGDHGGLTVALSADGNTLLSTKSAGFVFTFNGSTFVQVDLLQVPDPPGYTTEITSGDISGDGKTIVFSSFTRLASNVDILVYCGFSVFTFNGTHFVQGGNPVIINDFISLNYGVFSSSISADGKTVIVGGIYDDGTTGAAWIYTFNGSNFVELDKLVGSESISDEQGYCVDISADGTTAIVGSLIDHEPGNTYGSGTAWIYTFNGSHFIEVNKLTTIPFTSQNGDSTEQISTVAISGDGKTAVLGSQSTHPMGAIWVYTFNGSQFDQSDVLSYTAPGFNQALGFTVNISSDGKSIITGTNIDSVHYCALIYKFDGNKFVPENLIKIKDTIANGILIYSLSLSENGRVAAIGSAIAHGNGAAWVFGPCTNPTITSTTGNIAVCEKSRAVLSVTAIGAPLNFQWYQDGIFIPGAINQKLVLGYTSLASAGNYTCVVSNECRTVTSPGINLVIYALPTITGNVFPSPVCLGDPVTITGAGALTLSITGGITLGTGFIPTISGMYTLTGIDGYQCSNTGIAIVTIVSPLSLTISGNNSICPGTSTQLTVSGANNYIWSNGVNAATNMLTPSMTTTYQVTGTGSNQCPDYQIKALVTVTVTSIVSIPIAGKNLVCAGDSAYFSVNNVSDIKWFNNATTTSIALLSAGLIPVSLTGITDQGCKGQGSSVLISDNVPDIKISGNALFCLGSIASLTASGASMYHWSNGIDNQFIQVVPAVSSIYTVTGTYGNGCSSMATVTVTSVSLPSVSLDLASIGNVCDTSQMILLAGGTPVGGSYFYQGSKTDHLNISGAGSYPITYLYVDHNHCSNSASSILVVNHCTVPGICERPNPPCYCTKTCPPPFKIYSGITPNGDQINDTWVIDSLPAENNVVILDKWGNEIYKTENYANTWSGKKDDGKQLPNGVYYYVLELVADKKKYAGTIAIIR